MGEKSMTTTPEATKLPSVMTLEDELAQLTKKPDRGGNGSKLPAATNAIMEACLRAADIIRAIPNKELETGEEIAKKLEDLGVTFADRLAKIGDEFRDSCRHAAEALRKLRAIPEDNAAETADELVRIGQSEAERHAGVTAGINDIRGALTRIAGINDNKT
jgi:hypothetical protein